MSFERVNFSASTGSLAKALAVRMPESADSMSALMTAVFFLTRREAVRMALRREKLTRMNTGIITATTSVSRHSIVAMTASAPTMVTNEMNRSSGPWWASSVISNRSVVIRLMSWPVRLRSKNSKPSSCMWPKSAARISASTRMPNVWPQ